MAAGSMHIGSGPGVAGLSGMQVKLLVPLRTVRILPPFSMTTIVACLPTLGGAADSALAMSCAWVGPGLAAAGLAGASAASAAQLHAVRMAPTSNRIGRTDARMMILLGPGRSGPLWRADIGPSGCPRPVARAAARRAAPRRVKARSRLRDAPQEWCPGPPAYFFSPASTRSLRRFCGGGSGQVAKSLSAHGGL